MVQVDPSTAIIRREVQSVTFGFYTDEEVRNRSFVEVTSPQSLDSMGAPLPNGLYDARFGPTDSGGTPCITCGCLYGNCPGHAGHLELCVPVYHPLLFSNLVKLLRIKCFACHKFRMASRPLQIFQTKFCLLQQGRVKECLELEQALAVASKRAREEATDAQSTPLAVEQAMDQVLREKQQQQNTSKHEPTSYERAIHQQLVKEFISQSLQSKTCNHCGAFSPKIRQDSSNKIFQAPLSEGSKRMNRAENIFLKSALEKLTIKEGDGYDSDDTAERNVDLQDSSDDEEDEDALEEKDETDKYMHALEVEAQVKWTHLLHPQLCEYLFCNKETFFMRAIPIPPARFRPPMVLGTMTVEHAQNASLNKMLQQNDRIRTLLGDQENPAKSQAMAYTTWIDLQTTVNCFMDSSKDPSAASSMNQQTGIRQILEKKEGIFRKHMMGKRVDFACRSVISPDPYIGTNEIGIPLHFAKTLTYPTPVTGLNAVQMRELVIRGPDEYPGAAWVQFPDGRRVALGKMDRHRREGVAARLLTHLKKGGAPAMVGRQLRNGDMMLVNRQPTLHKPGIMAHSVRVLHSPTQKTIRMHYANCNTYNADYDGDEMNGHYPQSDLASAEAKYIASTDLQYIVPTDGSPLRGLIQDHVDSGVKMTSKNTFFEKWEYQQLTMAALASLPGLEVIRSDADIELLPPAIMKPKELWTGKQVISTLLRNLRRGNDRDDTGKADVLPGISVERKAKTPEHGFGSSQEEHLVLIRDGELLRGVLDKAAYGSTEFSLVHAVYEAYGPSKAGLLLNSLGRLFTAHLQYYSGHSCRMEDLILTKDADANRRRLVQRAYNVGSRAARAWADSEGGKVEIDSVRDKPGAEKPLKPFEAASASAKIGTLLSGSEGKENFAALDGYMQSQLNPLASEIIKACLPNGLAVPFPANTFGLMVSTGAKGSTVNQSQVSCALGQQALEGRRVPRMSSGRTLPSFAPFDPNPRADGFIMDRFLTGIRPQEYYFHCMAGREGLVDTAVKTSRSGYLQRCLVKHLEELKICYDSTVRNGEGGVVQFLYGEDGLDPTKATYLDCSSRTFEYMARNHDALALRNSALPDATLDLATNDAERSDAISKESSLKIKVGSFVKARKLRVGSRWIRGALCRGWFDAVVVKRHKSKGDYDLKYLRDGKIAKHVPMQVDLGRCGGVTISAASSICSLIKPAVPDPVLSGAARESGVHRLGSSGACVSEKVAGAVASALKTDKKLQEAMKNTGLSSKDFSHLVAAKYGSALCAPGEAVGCIAAQSVGEPSTQMTLNTFHLAGSGANVTLGIPRLREIIMTASKELKTPTMSVPLRACVSEKEAVRMTRDFTRLTLMEVIACHEGVQVTTTLQQNDGGSWDRAYYVTLKLHPAERIMEAFGLKLPDIARAVTKTFIPKLGEIMKRELRRSTTEGESSSIEVHGAAPTEYMADEPTARDKAQSSRNMEKDELEEEDDGDDEAAGEEDGVNATRFGRKEEMTSYGDMDDEDRAVAKASDHEDDDDMEEDSPPSSQTAAPTTNSQSTFGSFDGGNTVKINYKRNALVITPLTVDPAARPLLMVGLVERAASVTLVRSKPKIQQAFINEENDRGRCLQTAGVNFEEIWKLPSAKVEHNKLASNDIWAIRCAYGVEAARLNIVEQIRSVFGAYGISVDPRHLSLIADYMTFDGGFKAMNRTGMADCSSPFLQMSFETTANFMMDAALGSRTEHLVSPSANIVLGRPIRHGTGAFDLMAK